MHGSQQTSHVVCGRRVHLWGVRGVRRVLWGYSLFQTVTCGYSICSTDFQSDSGRAIDIIGCLLQVCDEVRCGAVIWSSQPQTTATEWEHQISRLSAGYPQPRSILEQLIVEVLFTRLSTAILKICILYSSIDIELKLILVPIQLFDFIKGNFNFDTGVSQSQTRTFNRPMTTCEEQNNVFEFEFPVSCKFD